MNILEITPEVLMKVWDSSGENFYCLNSGKICSSSDFSEMEKPENSTQVQCLFRLGYIPFVSVTNDEVLRAYARIINNQKIKNVIEHSNEDEYADVFWKYFNIYPDMLEEYKKFENKYVLDKISNWCKDNSLEYKFV